MNANFIRFVTACREISLGSLVVGLAWVLAIGPGCGTFATLSNTVLLIVGGLCGSLMATLLLAYLLRTWTVITDLITSFGVAVFLAGVGYAVFGGVDFCSGSPDSGYLMMLLGSVIVMLSLI